MDGQLLLPLTFMTDEEKGYHCPDNCPQCPYQDTLCIVFSAKGRRNYRAWEKKQKEGRK